MSLTDDSVVLFPKSNHKHNVIQAISVSSLDQPAEITERITLETVDCTVLILVILTKPARLRGSQGRIFVSDLADDFQLRPFAQKKRKAYLRRSFADTRQPVRCAYIYAPVAARYADVSCAADAEL